MADRLQPGLQVTNANLGVVNEISRNFLFAEEYYRTAIDINSRHYFPFERLGFVYMNTTNYAMADSFFYEADLRKKGFHFRENEISISPQPLVESPYFPFFCDMDTLVLKKDDIMAFFTWGVQNYDKTDYINADRILKRVVALDKKNPLVFHYLGKIFYDQKNWETAEVMFKYAAQYWLNDARFKRYCDSVIKSKKYPYQHDCFENFFRKHYYEKIEDYYFLAKLYESWAHYEEAEIFYRKIISFKPADLGGYLKLWQMLEKLGRYTEAEKVIKSFSAFDKERSDRELNEFYRRTIKQIPENGDWPYRLGLFLYDRASLKSRALYFDTIIWFPKLNKEIFMDFDNYSKIGNELSWDISIHGSPKKVNIEQIHENRIVIHLPGIDEYIVLADAIYTPRKDAIEYLLKADSLLTETEVKADINFKVGNVYVWAGSKKQSYPYYARSVNLIPDNASARLSLIDVCKAIYKNRAGLEQLNYLYDHRQINFPKRLLFAEFLIHSGQFDTAKKVIEEAQAIHPYQVPETFDLLGRLNLLSGQAEQAIRYYKDYLNAMYAMATQYAKSGNQNEAWKWLEESMKKGFIYSWVLQFDPAWSNVKSSKKWIDLINRFPKKKYPIPTDVTK
jgi:tetratricopeptide (TPR) repeat protein